jgi:hypothetical protein
MKKTKLFLAVVLVLVLGVMVQAQEQRGSLRGTVRESAGSGLPGATVTLSSPALMRPLSYVSTGTGSYNFLALPPGTFTLTCELPAFKTLVQENIVISVGKAVTLNIVMEPSTVAEQVTVTAPSPTIDVKQVKIATTVTREMIANLPLARDLTAVQLTAPGVVGGEYPYVHGGTVRNNEFKVDGVNMTDPVNMRRMADINLDVMEEVEIGTASHSAEMMNAGALINVVTRSGGNTFSGSVYAQYASKSLVENLFTDEQFQAMGVPKPGSDIFSNEVSFTLGGPIVKNKLWFFTALQYRKRKLDIGFVPFTDFFGNYHAPYSSLETSIYPFVKLSYQATNKLKLVAMLNAGNEDKPNTYAGPYITKEASMYDHNIKRYVGTLTGTYLFGANTFVDAKLGYAYWFLPEYLQPEVADKPLVEDFGSPYHFLYGGYREDAYRKAHFQGGLYLTHYMDNFLGGSHELKSGVEYGAGNEIWGMWRQDNMIVYMNSLNPGGYYYGLETHNGIPNVGTGLIMPYAIQKEPNKDFSNGVVNNQNRRISLFVQDNFTYKKRLTLNLGLRFDTMWDFHPPTVKGDSGNPVTIWLGDNYIVPYSQATWPEYFPDGINPYRAIEYGGWKNIFNFKMLQPRLGVSYDPFGNGKTAIKFSFNRYMDYLMNMYISFQMHPLGSQYPMFYWWDMNGNGTQDTNDDYQFLPSDLRFYSAAFVQTKRDPNYKTPFTDEFTVGIHHQLFERFSVGINFISREWKNILRPRLYSPDDNLTWYYPGSQGANEFTVPFTTVVPGQDGYPNQEMTIYMTKTTAPATFTQMGTVPEYTMKYRGVELVFDKRWSDGWQLSGSIVVSKTYGNIGGTWDETYGSLGGATSPNNFVNDYGRVSQDVPLVIKLMGTAKLPLGFLLSGYFRALGGTHWGRTAWILPPLDWCIANGVWRNWANVKIEAPDSRKNVSSNSLDLRLEKDLKFGKLGTLALSLDAINVFGYRMVYTGLNDVYTYTPTAENTVEPNQVTSPSLYKTITGVEGQRSYRLNFRFTF